MQIYKVTVCTREEQILAKSLQIHETLQRLAALHQDLSKQSEVLKGDEKTRAGVLIENVDAVARVVLGDFEEIFSTLAKSVCKDLAEPPGNGV